MHHKDRPNGKRLTPNAMLLGLTALLLAFTACGRTGAIAVGDITTVAGGFTGDGGPATSALLSFPSGVTVDALGNLFIASHKRTRRVDIETGVITTVAGDGTFGFSGDGGPATSASFRFPVAVAVDSAGNLFIADSENHRIRRVDGATGAISTVAGTGSFSGDGGTATSARLNRPRGVVVDASGDLFIADCCNHRIRRVASATGVITTVAGDGTPIACADAGSAPSASLNSPIGVAVDALGNLFIADFGSHRVRRVDAATGVITTVAGDGTYGFSGDGGPATSARLRSPTGVAVDASGNLFIADSGNNRIRRVEGIAAAVAPERP